MPSRTTEQSMLAMDMAVMVRLVPMDHHTSLDGVVVDFKLLHTLSSYCIRCCRFCWEMLDWASIDRVNVGEND